MALKFCHPHINYRSPKGQMIVDTIYRSFQYWARGDPIRIAKQYGVPASTARRWHKTWTADPLWRPYDSTRRCLSHRIFSDAEESRISERIRNEILTPGMLFTDEDFRHLIMEEHLGRYGDVPWDEILDFHVSAGFISDFKKRNRFSSRRGHYKRRPSVDPARCAEWRQEIETLLANVDHDLILNGDETSWCLHPRGVTTWATRGAENIAIQIGGSEKECLTVMATVRASGRKDPLYILAHGKTRRVEESQIGNVGQHLRDHSESGWMTADTFSRYLEFVRGLVVDRTKRLHLLLDVYPVHIQQVAREHAGFDLNIELHFIPAGCTDQYQPLDRRIFGCLKAAARGQFMRRAAAERGTRVGKQAAVQSLIHCWTHLSESTVRSAWDIYRGEPDDSE
jgi:hypothetical protein